MNLSPREKTIEKLLAKYREHGIKLASDMKADGSTDPEIIAGLVMYTNDAFGGIPPGPMRERVWALALEIAETQVREFIQTPMLPAHKQTYEDGITALVRRHLRTAAHDCRDRGILRDMLLETARDSMRDLRIVQHRDELMRAASDIVDAEIAFAFGD